ncbi:hypothetical protein QWJ39_06285 [Arthrobacter sp. YD4]|uniref:hypothetical protein n=1 Tax=Arthrobacter sp. YD4 TaxID=3058043 RepID=UPI0025B378C0|nr:hypothetical protein [Arthrobacter sp. YD4]MDN3935917.1 hypothetical protein [Arthrobacter sp. YD4]
MGRDEKSGDELRTGMSVKYRAVLAVIGLLAAAVVTLSTGQAWAGVAMLLVFVSLGRMTARIRCDGTGVHLKVAGLFSTTVAYADIVDVTPGPETGLGLRVLRGGGTGYLVGGPTLRIRANGAWVLVSCADPDAGVELIRARGGLAL